jgi:hypothetical protein
VPVAVAADGSGTTTTKDTKITKYILVGFVIFVSCVLAAVTRLSEAAPELRATKTSVVHCSCRLQAEFGGSTR